jgi:hypothetical protein
LEANFTQAMVEPHAFQIRETYISTSSPAESKRKRVSSQSGFQGTGTSRPRNTDARIIVFHGEDTLIQSLDEKEGTEVVE